VNPPFVTVLSESKSQQLVRDPLTPARELLLKLVPVCQFNSHSHRHNGFGAERERAASIVEASVARSAELFFDQALFRRRF
jgi:hypothetical protein